MEKTTGLLANIVIWFGVAVSVSEIECGIEIGRASSHFWFPLILGHLIGGLMLFAVGHIGAITRLNAMGTTASTYGKYGSKFFALLNLLQLVGWIAVLNAQGALALGDLNLPLSFPLICVLLAIFICIWIFVGLQRSSVIATVVMTFLAILLAVLTFKLFGVTVGNNTVKEGVEELGFWTIFEISAAMPLSWLPVISDYTKNVEKPVAATALSALTYTLASLWMYFIGVQISALGEGFNIGSAILFAGFGIPGILIVVISTVTTNFLAANSAGESAKTLYNPLKPKWVGVVVCGISTVLAILGIVDHYIKFLYLIASVFAPMAAVLLVSFYLVHEHVNKRWYFFWNIGSWAVGFVVYQFAGNSPIGPSLTAILVSGVLSLAAKLVKFKI